MSDSNVKKTTKSITLKTIDFCEKWNNYNPPDRNAYKKINKEPEGFVVK